MYTGNGHASLTRKNSRCCSMAYGALQAFGPLVLWPVLCKKGLIALSQYSARGSSHSFSFQARAKTKRCTCSKCQGATLSACLTCQFIGSLVYLPSPFGTTRTQVFAAILRSPQVAEHLSGIVDHAGRTLRHLAAHPSHVRTCSMVGSGSGTSSGTPGKGVVAWATSEWRLSNSLM